MRLGKLTGEYPSFYENNTLEDMTMMGNNLNLAKRALEEYGKVEEYLLKHKERLTKAELQQAAKEIDYYTNKVVSSLNDAINILRMIKAKTRAYSEVVSQWL